MKVLIVCSGNKKSIAPFIKEQGDALEKSGIVVEYFLIDSGGLFGYLKNLKKLKVKIVEFRPSLIHAHFGLSGLLSNLQRIIPVVTTYHGSDVNNQKIFLFSKFSMLLSAQNIFVSQKIFAKSKISKGVVIPCGIDKTIFFPMDKSEARKKIGLDLNKNYILFSSRFDIPVKNYTLAKEAIELLNNKNVELVELKNYSRSDVALLLNACDVALMTSLNEGSPQFIKEAMACNCPIVSTNVGDVKENVSGIEGCYITSYSPKDIAGKIQLVIQYGRTNCSFIAFDRFDNMKIVENLIKIYESI